MQEKKLEMFAWIIRGIESRYLARKGEMKTSVTVKGMPRRDITTIHKYLMVENINKRQCWSESKFRNVIKEDFF